MSSTIASFNFCNCFIIFVTFFNAISIITIDNLLQACKQNENCQRLKHKNCLKQKRSLGKIVTRRSKLAAFSLYAYLTSTPESMCGLHFETLGGSMVWRNTCTWGSNNIFNKAQNICANKFKTISLCLSTIQ